MLILPLRQRRSDKKASRTRREPEPLPLFYSGTNSRLSGLEMTTKALRTPCQVNRNHLTHPLHNDRVTNRPLTPETRRTQPPHPPPTISLQSIDVRAAFYRVANAVLHDGIGPFLSLTIYHRSSLQTNCIKAFINLDVCGGMQGEGGGGGICGVDIVVTFFLHFTAQLISGHVRGFAGT